MQSKKCLKSAMLIAAVAGLAGVAAAGGPFPGPQPIGPDVTLCQVYGFAVSGRTGTFPNGTSGGTLGTTSWNIGTAQLLWEQSPDGDHPKIAMDLFRKDTFTMSAVQVDRLQQVGQSWCKHGFFALSNQQCGTHPWAGQNGAPTNCVSTNGTRLGLGCTDNDICHVLDVDRPTVARGQQQEPDIRNTLQRLAGENGERLAALAKCADHE